MSVTRRTLWTHSGTLPDTAGEWFNVGPQKAIDGFQEIGLAAISAEAVELRLMQLNDGVPLEVSQSFTTTAGNLPGDGVIEPAMLPYVQVQHKNTGAISSAVLVLRGDELT